MNTLEFTTKIKDGKIRLPKPYRKKLENKNTRVSIIIKQDEQANYNIDKIESILSDMKKQNAFSKIDNPSAWQKEIRNEWQ